MKNKMVTEFVDACLLFQKEKQRSDKNDLKKIAKLGVDAFHSALEQLDPLKRFEMINQVVISMKVIAHYDSNVSDFLLAKKKMTNYMVLDQLMDPTKVSFTLQDCALLSQRYYALKDKTV